MKHTIFRNPFFYLSTILFFVLLFQITQVVLGAATFQEAPCAPPGCLPNPPVDISSFNQTKEGDLNVKGDFRIRGSGGLFVETVRKIMVDGIEVEDVQKSVNIRSSISPGITFQDGTNIATLRLNDGVLGFIDVNRVSFTPLGAGGDGLWTRPSDTSFARLADLMDKEGRPTGKKDGISVGSIATNSISMTEGNLTLTPKRIEGDAATVRYFYRPKKIVGTAFRRGPSSICDGSNIPKTVSPQKYYEDTCKGLVSVGNWKPEFRTSRLTTSECSDTTFNEDALPGGATGAADCDYQAGVYETTASAPDIAYDLILSAETDVWPYFARSNYDLRVYTSAYEYEKYSVPVAAGSPVFLGGNISANEGSFAGALSAPRGDFEDRVTTGYLTANNSITTKGIALQSTGGDIVLGSGGGASFTPGYVILGGGMKKDGECKGTWGQMYNVKFVETGPNYKLNNTTRDMEIREGRGIRVSGIPPQASGFTGAVTDTTPVDHVGEDKCACAVGSIQTRNWNDTYFFCTYP